jgi:bifunctional non-homologous end joining protein LigD
MLATLGQPPTRFADFAVEARYDGQRGIAAVPGVTVSTRKALMASHTFLDRRGVDGGSAPVPSGR